MINKRIDRNPLKIELDRMEDGNGKPYFVGKLSAPLDLKLTEGALILVFTAEEGTEELQISRVDPDRSISTSNSSGISVSGKVHIKLISKTDQYDKEYYLAQVKSPVTLSADNPGLFFTVFTSRKGREELQISTLQEKPKTVIEERFNYKSVS